MKPLSEELDKATASVDDQAKLVKEADDAIAALEADDGDLALATAALETAEAAVEAKKEEITDKEANAEVFKTHQTEH
jgi:hypothetical protein